MIKKVSKQGDPMTNLYWRGVTWLLENDRYQKIVFLAVIAAATLLGAAVALDPNS